MRADENAREENKILIFRSRRFTDRPMLYDVIPTRCALLTDSASNARASRGETSSRRQVRRLRRLAWLCAALIALPAPVVAQVNILTNRYDPQRTGANLAETTLTAGNVTAARFGKLYTIPVDGAVYAQPLYVGGVTIGGVVRNVLYVATMNDKLYAFDADQPSA